ncbi:MAG: PaaI family thioesterase [Fusobacteriaceae bacterium]|nr:PaaI family thioesterase [Fusobacteriaceae bacterium]
MDYKEIMDLANQHVIFAKLIGIEITELDAEHCTGVLRVREELLNPHGFLHGGIYYTLADSVSGVLTFSDRRNVTVEGKMNFIKGAPVGTLIKAVGRKIHQGKKTGVCEVYIYDEKEELLTVGIFTMFYID